MKGVVFTQFLEMVENVFSEEMADKIIEASDLPSGGVYTSLGTYDHHEILQMVTHLSEETGIPISVLVSTFGGHLFDHFFETFPKSIVGAEDVFSLLRGVDNYIHVEVRKLYPDAELPRFDHEMPTPEQLILVYNSRRPMAMLAKGLIERCITHFGEEISVEMEDLSDGVGTSARFVLTRNS